MQYIRLCKTLADKGELIPITEDVYKRINPERDYYRSIYYYNDEHFKRFYSKVIDDKGRETIAGCSGIEDVTTSRLVFDFDSENNLEAAKSDAIELCTRLINSDIPQESIQICFSGNKGFGIEVDTDSTFTPQQFKNVVFSLARDLKTFDKTINNPSRVMRLPMTKHPESRLYKYPLTLDELMGLGIEDIKSMAKNNDIDVREQIKSGFWGKVKLPQSIQNMKNTTPEKQKEKAESIKTAEEIDLANKPSWLSKCKYALSLGFFESGMRHYPLMMLAANYKKQGFPKEAVYRLLKSAADLQAQRTGDDRYSDKELYRYATDVFKPDWKGGTYTCREEGWLREYCQEHGFNCGEDSDEVKLVTVDNVFEKFKNYAQNIDNNTIKTGIEELDKKVRMTTSMLVGLLAAPSSGKTSVAINMLSEINKIGEKAAFYSLDMGEPLIYQKLAQKYTGYSGEKLFEIFSTTEKKIERLVASGIISKERGTELKNQIPNFQKEIVEINSKISENFKNVKLCFKSGLTVADIRQDLINYQQQSGEKIKLVVVDYLECLQGPYSDSTANTSIIAQKLKDLANELEVCVLLLLQPQKMAGDPSDPLVSYRNIKGSSAIEQACSVIISLWRDGFNPENQAEDRYITFAVLKNRMGVLSTVECSWDGVTGTIVGLNAEEKEELKTLRAKRAREKAEKNEI